MYTGRDNCALPKSLNFVLVVKLRFFSSIVRYTQRNALFFNVFQKRTFFYSVRSCLNIAG